MKERIKAVRMDCGLTQAEFADRLNVSRSSILNWEYGQNKPAPAMVEKLCNVFNVNPLYMTGQSDIMHLPPDEDEEIIDRALKNSDPLLKALILGIVKKPEGWQMLAKAVLSAADILRQSGYDIDEDNLKRPGD